VHITHRPNAVGTFDKISMSASEPRGRRSINQGVGYGYGHIAHFPGLPAAVNVARFSCDPAHGDYQGWGAIGMPNRQPGQHTD
jgi:hypothetical protein